MSSVSVRLGPLTVAALVSGPTQTFAVIERRAAGWPEVDVSNWLCVQTIHAQEARALRVVAWPVALLFIWGGP
jgi:hypothetical protein